MIIESGEFVDVVASMAGAAASVAAAARHGQERGKFYCDACGRRVIWDYCFQFRVFLLNSTNEFDVYIIKYFCMIKKLKDFASLRY